MLRRKAPGGIIKGTHPLPVPFFRMFRERSDTEREIRSHMYDILAFLSKNGCTEDVGLLIESDLRRIVETRIKAAAQPAAEGGAV